MRYMTLTQPENTTYPICFLVPQIRQDEIVAAYIEPFGLNQEEVLAIDLHHTPGKKKTPKAEMVAYIEQELQPVLDDMKVEYLAVADVEYFKTITKSQKGEANLGYVLDSAFGSQKVVYIPNYKAIFYDPEKIRAKILLGMDGLLSHRKGTYSTPGAGIIHKAAYPSSIADIERWLVHFVDQNIPLTADIEAYSLRHTKAGIGTISFAWNQHEGIAFAVDYGRDPADAKRLRKMLAEFFRQHKAGITWHHIAFDVYVLIYQLFMSDILDTEGLLDGLAVMLDNWDCTKIITYLATNSCAGNRLGLKEISQEFSGNYAIEEIKDITKVPLPELLQYNLIDALSTWYARDKYYPIMIADQQLDIYNTIFKPAMLEIIQMQLTGMPVNMERAQTVDAQLSSEEAKLIASIQSHSIVKLFTSQVLDVEHTQKRNAKLKVKQIQVGDEPQLFNPNSDLQVRALLFDFLGLPVINLTDNKLPSTDGESIEALLNRVDDDSIKSLLADLQLLTIVTTLTSTFMPAILAAEKGPDGWHYLFGSFNLGGTLSGRLSSSGPNLQNLPSTGKGHKLKLGYAKLIKSCFAAPPGWLFVGADFPSLEDRISALTTKDPNKLKVYTDGYDGHSLRAYAYWPAKMPDIDPNSVESINSISKKYKPLRDRSKNPTFTLTYQGTKHALMKKYGFTEAEADEVVERYQALYQVSIQWVEAKLDQAMKDGYITAAFGLRVRTPLLKQVIRGTSKTPYEAEAEGRTAGNALGQSWCMLNTRAGSEFMGYVRTSKYRLDIRPCAQIHDAQYYIIRDHIGVVKYVNDNLPAAMAWQDHPEIYHDDVKLAGAEVGIFYPDWNHEIGIPNGATTEEIFAIIDEAAAA